VYAAASVLSFFAVLPIAPFAHKLHRVLTIAVAVAFIVSTVYTLSAFPFTPADNIKVYFQQQVELPPQTTPEVPAKATTLLVGVSPFVQRLADELPSAFGKHISCEPYHLRGPGLTGCTWDTSASAWMPSPSHKTINASDWVKYTAERSNATSLRIKVQGQNTRDCRIFFDSRFVDYFHVRGGTPDTRPAFPIPEGGVNEIRLWSRDWGKEWVVDAGWTGVPAEGERIRGRVACEWAEYESGAAGGKSRSGGRIPALEDVIANLPDVS
jgi:hypothetical protein